MTTSPDDEPDQIPSEEDPEEPGIGAQETPPMTEPDVAGWSRRIR